MCAGVRPGIVDPLQLGVTADQHLGRMTQQFRQRDVLQSPSQLPHSLLVQSRRQVVVDWHRSRGELAFVVVFDLPQPFDRVLLDVIRDRVVCRAENQQVLEGSAVLV